jgi:hypothetical protein
MIENDNLLKLLLIATNSKQRLIERQIIKTYILFLAPVTVAERSRACTVFARLEAGTMGSNPIQGMDVWCLCMCVFLCLCIGRGLVTN